MQDIAINFDESLDKASPTDFFESLYHAYRRQIKM